MALGRSWEAFWRHVGSLGVPFGFILALLGRLGVTFWPKLAQVSLSWQKKLDFCNLPSAWGAQVGPPNRPKSKSKNVLFSDAFLTSICIDFLSILHLKFGRFFDRFLN